MDISSLVKSEDLALVFDEENTLNVTINPSKLTPAVEAEINAADEDDSMVLVDTLLNMVTEWDLVDNGQPVPLTRDALSHQPTIGLMLIMTKISTTLQEKAEAEGKISAAT